MWYIAVLASANWGSKPRFLVGEFRHKNEAVDYAYNRFRHYRVVSDATCQQDYTDMEVEPPYRVSATYLSGWDHIDG